MGDCHIVVYVCHMHQLIWPHPEGIKILRLLASSLYLFAVGGPAERAGLKKQEVVVAVNGQDTTFLSHHDVVSIIFSTKTPGVWLTVCEGPESSAPAPHTPPTGGAGSRLALNRVHSLGSYSMSQSTPVFPRNMTDSRYSTADDSPPKYQDLATYSRQGSGNAPSRHSGRETGNVPPPAPPGSTRMSPLTKTLLTQSVQHNGYSSSSSVIHRRPLQLKNTTHLASFGMSDNSLFANSKSSPTPAAASFTSATVLVFYIGSVEIPESWSSRELSSKCLQECTRHLLSQRQEFVEAFLEVTLSSMKILAVSQAEIYKHKREELYYAGVCSNDEQTFGIVTRKLEHKSGKKSISSSSIGKPMRAHMCHVFKVIQHKSVLVLHSGGADSKDSKTGKSSSSKQLAPQHKEKTISVKSCVTIVNAIQGLFTGAAMGGTKLFDETSGLKAHSGSGSSNESMSYGNGTADKSKKKKLDVVDLRLSAFVTPPSSSILTSSTPGSNQNMYVSLQHTGNTISTSNITPSPLANHTRSHSNPSSDYLGTPAYHHQRSGVGGNVGGGGGGGNSWYATDSPKEEYHSRTRSWDNKSPQSLGGGSSGRSHERSPHERSPHEPSSSSSGNRRANKNSNGLQFGDKVRPISDDSSLSSFSDSRASSPTKISHRSSFTSHSRSPSPNRSLTYSSRSPSPVRSQKWMNPRPRSHSHRTGAHAARRLKSGMALEVSSIRSGAISPNSMARSGRGSRALRRQVSQSGVICMLCKWYTKVHHITTTCRASV